MGRLRRRKLSHMLSVKHTTPKRVLNHLQKLQGDGEVLLAQQSTTCPHPPCANSESSHSRFALGSLSAIAT